MALYKFTNGTVANANEVNANFATTISFPILNRIAIQNDRSVLDIGAGNTDQIFSEAYTDTTGREDTVNTGNTTATHVEFDVSSYPSGILQQATVPGPVYTNSNSTASGTTETAADTSYSSATSTLNGTIRFYFTANSDLYVKQITLGTNTSTQYNLIEKKIGDKYYTIAQKSGASVNGYTTFTFTLSDYSNIIKAGEEFRIQLNGSFPRDGNNSFSLPVTGTHFDWDSWSQTGSIAMNTTGGGFTVETITASNTNDAIIEHDIPSGTFPATVSKLVGKAAFAYPDSGATVEHRLENATENSGWITDGTMGSFTAFTSEPTKYKVRLNSTNGNSPAIYGSGVYSQ